MSPAQNFVSSVQNRPPVPPFCAQTADRKRSEGLRVFAGPRGCSGAGNGLETPGDQRFVTLQPEGMLPAGQVTPLFLLKVPEAAVFFSQSSTLPSIAGSTP